MTESLWRITITVVTQDKIKQSDHKYGELNDDYYGELL